MPCTSSTGEPEPDSVAKISLPCHDHGRRVPPSAFVGTGALLSALFVAASAPVSPAPARNGRTIFFTPSVRTHEGPYRGAVATALPWSPASSAHLPCSPR